MPASLPEATILVPGVKRRVVAALLDFLYTGEMKVEREDTAELQLLIETLQIDPSLISVECLDNESDDDSTTDDEEEEEDTVQHHDKKPEEATAKKRKAEDDGQGSSKADDEPSSSSSSKVPKVSSPPPSTNEADQ